MFIYLIVIILFSFVLYPYVYLSTKASLMVQGCRTIEAANTLGIPTNKLLRKVIIPIIRPAIIAGASLVVMETLNDYAAVEYFGISTLTIGIFRSWFGMNDIASALKLSSFLIIFVFVILVFEKLYRKGAKYNNEGGKHSLRRISIKKRKQNMIIIFCLIPFTFGFLIPVMRLLSWILKSDFSLNNFNLLVITYNTIMISIISSIIDISKELPLTLILRPFNFDTLATLTYDLVNQAQFFQSSIPSLLIILISAPAIFIINKQITEKV